MEWKLFANLAETAGEKRVTVDVEPGATVDDALEALFAAHPELREPVLEDGEVAEHLNVLKNGADVRDGAGLDATVEQDDELALFPPVSGG